jgi:hypothetical protein
MGCRWLVGCKGSVCVRWRWKRNNDFFYYADRYYVSLSPVKTCAEASTPRSAMSLNLVGSSNRGANLAGIFSAAISVLAQRELDFQPI